MVRRFYSDTTNPATGEQDKVTAHRDIYDGSWYVNEIAKTKIVDGYYYDVPGEHIATVIKDGSRWNVKSLRDGNVPGFGTLASAVQYIMERNRA